MKSPKKPASFRLSETTIKEISALAKTHSVSQADVIAVLVHCFYAGLDFEDWDTYFDIVRLG